jgi:hypothetical protein
MIKLPFISNLKLNILVKVSGFFLSVFFLLNPGSLYAVAVKKGTADSSQKVVISAQAATEIKYQAESVVHTLEVVLNSITFNDNSPSETANYISSSYTPNLRNRIFFNDRVIIEDDINPKFELGKNRDLEVTTYLNELDLNYQKTSDFSIKFSNIQSSNVKITNHIYIRVKFDCAFGSRYKIDGGGYTVRQREALIRMEPDGKKKWNAFIEGISFYNPALSIDNTDHDVLVTNESLVAADNDSLRQPVLVRNKMPIGNKHINSADHKLVQYINNKEGKLIEYPDFSVVFNKNLKAPDVKTTNPVFHLRISFDSDFGASKDAVDGAPSIQGEAVIRMERNGKNEWNAFVEKISFKSANKSQEEIVTPPGDSAVAAGITQMLDKSIKMAMLPPASTETVKKEGQK